MTQTDRDTALGEDHLVNAVFASAVAGGAWMAVGGFILGLAISLTGSRDRGWPSYADIVMAEGVGFVVATGGCLAGAAYAAFRRHWRITAATVVAGLANPALYDFGASASVGSRSLARVASTASVAVLPFLFGWLFARAMAGSRRIPLISWARRNVARVPDENPWNRRGIAFVFGGIPAWIVVMAGAAAFAYAFSLFETLLPLPPPPPDSD